MCDCKLVGKDEVKEMMGCSDQMACKVIRQLDKELAAQGVRTVSGKVGRTYLIERYCLPMQSCHSLTKCHAYQRE